MTTLFGKENILILAKTYPSPSAKYQETSCVAGITENGEMRRLYPVPFRRLEDKDQFSKWQWVKIEIEPNPQDKRKESRKIRFDNIKTGPTLAPKNFEKRMLWIEQIPKIEYFLPTLTTPDISPDITLALFTPQSGVRLKISKSSDKWTKEELEKLEQFNGEDILFKEEARIPATMLEKIPYDFYYVTKIEMADGRTRDLQIKLIDWEVCSLFRKCYKPDDDSWKESMKQKLETEMNNRNLKLLLGNMHRFPKQWMVVSLIYPPKQSKGLAAQRLLDL